MQTNVAKIEEESKLMTAGTFNDIHMFLMQTMANLSKLAGSAMVCLGLL